MNFNYRSSYVIALKAKICGFEHTSKKIRVKANRLEGDRKYHALQAKLRLGKHTREHLIAYGLLRGKDYASIESKCREGNEPDAQKIHDIIAQHVSAWERSRWSLQKVKQCLKRTPNEKGLRSYVRELIEGKLVR